ncbi:MAG: hypothetical protein M1822_000019 [Bathelium mastoideum]|nr:MAG: hypothetical protein M1822_000019 [Bathelium mastoideum]
MEDEATQPSTQAVSDPRRAGHNASGLSEADAADILCILHPCSPAAFAIVTETHKHSPQHVLQSKSHASPEQSRLEDPSEQETFILDSHSATFDLALRLSSITVRPAMGFTFGRNPTVNDIVLHIDSMRRISNIHFRIYINDSGVIMVQDMSTNGTLVDDVLLKQRGSEKEMTRMLQANSIIQILSPKPEDCIKFVVRLPVRDTHSHIFTENFRAFLARAKLAGQYREAQGTDRQATADTHGKRKQITNERVALQAVSSIKPAIPSLSHGMKWNGGDVYNVVSKLGTGAFATVYKLATTRDGNFFAAKELEKRKFMKNGVLDRRIENEMQIMQAVRHPNIVQYVDYQDVEDHLYIIMEYVPCGDLQGYLHQHEVLTEEQGRVMSRQILGALAYLHNQKITHRDIKPDNILIASEDPFKVKLSDFGLSKVVHDNDTFLKTFCGTLLYCAPEVFPHYSNRVPAKGQKRRRGTHALNETHSYNHSVDTWSYAAVLWFSLCSKPPFEGVADHTGLAMFNKIMETRLDISPLKFRAISDAGIDLLNKMLNTDPSQRPSERQCLTHPWLADGTELYQESDASLGAINEEEEEDSTAAAAPDMSQLSINDGTRHSQVPSQDNSVFGFNDFDDLLDLRQSKRPRDGPYAFREKGDTGSSFDTSGHSGFVLRESGPRSLDQGNGNRLFGEIGHSALQDSGALDIRTNAALAISRQDTSTTNDSETYQLLSNASNRSRDRSSTGIKEIRASDHLSGNGLSGSQKYKVGPAASLFGAESLVRDLHMESPPSANSPAAGEPSTPKTPDQHSQSTPSYHVKTPHSEEITPRPPPFNRQISIPFSASIFYSHSHPYVDESQGSKKADEVSFGSSLHLSENMASSPPDMNELHEGREKQENHQVALGRELESSHPAESASAEAAASHLTSSSAFTRPPPRLGKLTSTPDSFIQMTLQLGSRLSTWGRDPGNTHVYSNREDTRIPKRGILIWFHARGIENALSGGASTEWAKIEGLHTIISTESTAGIWINGVHLKRGTKETGTLYGRIYSGDEVTVFVGKGSETTPPEKLVFVCEFFHGEAASKRPKGRKFEVLQETK